MHGPRWRLVLIGAGQLTQYLAEMARMLDYHVSVIEPREEYASGWTVAGIALDRRMPDDVIAAMNLDGHSAVVALTHDPKIERPGADGSVKSAAFTSAPSVRRRTTTHAAPGCRSSTCPRRDRPFARSVGLYIGAKTRPRSRWRSRRDDRRAPRRERAELGGEEGGALRPLGVRGQRLEFVGLLLAEAAHPLRFDKLHTRCPTVWRSRAGGRAI